MNEDDRGAWCGHVLPPEWTRRCRSNDARSLSRTHLDERSWNIKPLLDVERSSGSARQACARMAAAARKFTRSSTSRRFEAGLESRRRHPSAIEHDEPEGETGV